jgi:signal transduction histidine kinase
MNQEEGTGHFPRIDLMANPLAGTVPDSPPETSSGQGADRLAGPADDPSHDPDEREAARRLRAQYAEISQLAGGLAHEIRNPLSTLSLNLDLLAEDFRDADNPRDRRAQQRVDRLKREVQRLYDILENFLRFARVQELKLSATDLNTLIEELCDFYEPQATTQGIVIRTHLAPDLPRPLIDADLLKQALLNLVLNAQHAMPEGGELIMTTRREGRWIVLDVIDTGAGMTDDIRARIFDPFYSTRPGGSGLGLPTTRKIIEAHGGTIDVQSVPGKGSRFSIHLPVPAPPNPQNA